MADAAHPSARAPAAASSGGPPATTEVVIDPSWRTATIGMARSPEDALPECKQCRTRKKCRAGQPCANHAHCKRRLEHGNIYGGDGTVGSGMYCSLYECKRKAGVPVSKANAKRNTSPGFSYPHVTPPRQAASEAQQPPDSAKASSQPDVIDLELDGASLEALVCIQSVKKILALRVCKDIARLTPSEVESLQPGSSTYQRAYLILADFLFAAGIQALRGAVRWVPEDILIEMAECNECVGEVDIACALAVFRNGPDSSQKD